MTAAVASAGKLATTIADCCCGGKFCWILWQWSCHGEAAVLASGTNAGCDGDAFATFGWDTWAWTDSSHLLYLQKGPSCTGGGDCTAFEDSPVAPADPDSDTIDLHCPFFRRARYCDGTYTDIYMPTALADAYTGAFKVNGTGDLSPYADQCLYFDFTDTLGHTHPGDIVLTDDAIIATWSDCGFCLGTKIPCDGDGSCLQLHVAVYIGGVLQCESDVPKTAPCFYSVGTPVSCGGSNFAISSVYYDPGTGRWTIAFAGLSGSAGFTFDNPDGDSSTIPLATYTSPDFPDMYAVLTCVYA